MEAVIPAGWNRRAGQRGKKKPGIRNMIRSAEVSDELRISDNTWIVLYKDERKKTVKLLSKDCVAVRSHDGEETWENSRLYRWLQEEYREGLSEELKKQLRDIDLPGRSEYEKYEREFPGELYRYGITGSNDYNWWLGTGSEGGYVEYVSYIRGNTDYAVTGQRMGIRPVMTVKYK